MLGVLVFPCKIGSMNTIEIPEELLKEAKRFGVDAKWLTLRLLQRQVAELAGADSLVVTTPATHRFETVARS